VFDLGGLQGWTDARLIRSDYGNLWKWRVIEHREEWVGIRNTHDVRPTFPTAVFLWAA
jgi:hypothetical protein